MSSFDSWIVHRPSLDAPNSTVNFYTVGAVASLCWTWRSDAAPTTRRIWTR
ncbi:MAG: hypothetical protein KF705_00955 [Phycisphaeraceae bacterium]|nr:hypothetical protein [Phycisphaeraceae bacterium]